VGFNQMKPGAGRRWKKREFVMARLAGLENIFSEGEIDVRTHKRVDKTAGEARDEKISGLKG